MGHCGAVPVEIVEADVERDDRYAREVGVPQNLDVRVLSPPAPAFLLSLFDLTNLVSLSQNIRAHQFGEPERLGAETLMVLYRTSRMST